MPVATPVALRTGLPKLTWLRTSKAFHADDEGDFSARSGFLDGDFEAEAGEALRWRLPKPIGWA